MRLVRALLVLAAAWGVLLSVALFSHRLPARFMPSAGPLAAPRAPACPACDCANSSKTGANAASNGAAAAVAAPPSAEAPAPEEQRVQPFAVCPREEATPALSRLRLGKDGPELWALHCGPSVHLFAIEREGAELVPRRVALFRIASESPAEAARAVPLAAVDFGGEGRSELALPVLFADHAGTPSGGAVYRLRQRAEGGFESQGRLLELAPGAAVAARLDRQKGEDLALLHLRDPRTARPNELWLVHGGAAPLRFATLDAGLGASAIAAADLDRDGLDDLLACSPSQGQARLWLSGAASHGAQPSAFALPGVREAVAGDLDGDGFADLVLSGERLWFLPSRAGSAPEATAIGEPEDMRDLELVDENHDGKLDIVGYAHPEAIALEQQPGLRFARRTLAHLHGELGVLFVRLAQLDANAKPDLVIVAVSNEPDARIELALAADVEPSRPVRLSSEPQTLRDAPLLQRFSLP